MNKHRNRKSKANIKRNKNFRIVLTHHAYNRLCRRYGYLPFDEMVIKVQNMINSGNLTAIFNNEEHYNHRGITFCCTWSTNHTGRVLVVKTVKLGSTRKRTIYSSDLSYEKIDTKRLDIKAS